MAFQCVRRALVAAACLSGALLAACGGSDEVVSQLEPKRVIAFGGGMADVGQTGSRFTINDGSTNIWVQQLAARYGLSLAPASAGGTGYATGNARVLAEPDAAGSTATLTVAEQIDSFLASGSFGSDDLVVVSAGIADIVAEVGQTQAGLQTEAQARSDIAQAGTQLGQQVRRLVQAGANNVIVVGPYDLGVSPWARSLGRTELIREHSKAFISALKISMVDLGGKVLYIDLEDYLGDTAVSPGLRGFVDVTTPVCTSVDPGPGIGIGAGQVNSALCTPATLRSDVAASTALFADPVYPTPAFNRLFGDFAYDYIRRFR